MRLIRWIGFGILQIALTFAAIEVVARVFDPIGISYYPETARYLDTMVQEEPIGYRNRPGLEGTFHGVPVRINSWGMRDREVAAKTPGEFRVLVIGDSFPFGVGVPIERSVPYQLEQLLNSAAGPGRTYRTLNMGVPSYNTLQELIQLREVGLSLEPDLAVLIFSWNDIEEKMWVFDRRRSWEADWAQRSYAISLAFVLVRHLRTLLGRPEQLIAVGEYRPDSPRWQEIDRSLKEIHHRCAERGIPLVVFTKSLKGSDAFQMVQGVGKREGFSVIDLSPSMDPRWKDVPPREFNNSIVDSHPNADGSHVYAVLLSEHLARAGLMPTPR